MKWAKLLLLLMFGLAEPAMVRAADPWFEARSPHFIVISDSGEKKARTVLSEFEQIRWAAHIAWPVLHLDTDTPVLVFAVRDAAGIAALVPRAERSTAGRVGGNLAVFAAGLDRHYLALRTDGRVDDRQGTVNPYRHALWGYFSLALQRRFSRTQVPVWFSHGVTGVLSNTIVNGSSIYVGQPIPEYAQAVRGWRPTMGELLGADRQSSWLQDPSKNPRFNAEAWALAHYLMFRDGGRSGVDRFVELLLQRKETSAAFAEAFGDVDSLTSGFMAQLRGTLWPWRFFQRDLRSSIDAVTVRPLPTSQRLSYEAAFLLATGQMQQARQRLDESGQIDGCRPICADVAGMMADIERNPQAAQQSYAKAIEGNSTSFFSYYRWAALSRRSQETQTSAKAVDALLRSVALNGTYAPSRELLAIVQLDLNHPQEALSEAQKAVALEPTLPRPRIALSRVLFRLGRRNDAEHEAEIAMALAATDAERKQVQQFLDGLAKAVNR
jgi:tetratricopeptide (TPR) repeat protein